MHLGHRVVLLCIFSVASTMAGCGDGGTGGPGEEGTFEAGFDGATDCVTDYCKATTTQYDGFTEWPKYIEQKDQKTYLYDALTLRNLGFTVVATPFALQLPNHMNSREEYIRAVINDADCGQPDCSEPSEGDSPGLCFELDDGTLLIPQEFCGGNGWPRAKPATWGTAAWPPAQWDVQNNCPGIVAAYSAGEQGLVSLCQEPAPNCKALCTLVNVIDGEPEWLDLTEQANMQDFIDAGSCLPSSELDIPPYVNPTDPAFEVSCSRGRQPNWCSGRNMHFDGINDKETGTTVHYKSVHCNKNGSRSVGHLGPRPLPPAPTQPDQLVINYLSSRGFAAVACEAPGVTPVTSINSGTSAPVVGSETAPSVSCYNSPTITFTHDIEGRSWSGPPDYTGVCTESTSIAGSYTCTVRDPS